MPILFAVLAAMILSASEVQAQAAKPRTEVTWYGHAAFVVKTPKGLVLAIDPWFGNPANTDKAALQKLTKVDYILLTHGHSDHVGEAVALAKKTGAKLVTNPDLAGSLVASLGFPKEQASLATLGNLGGTLPLTDEVSVTFVPAFHSSAVAKDDASQPLPGGNPLGFVIRIQGGPTIYHTGDTAAFDEMKDIGASMPIDLMLACIGGHFTMDPKGAARAAAMVKPKQLVPMHFGTFPMLTGTPAQLRSELSAAGAKTQVLEMKIGETRGF